jgi:hypothetical protein
MIAAESKNGTMAERLTSDGGLGSFVSGFRIGRRIESAVAIDASFVRPWGSHL